MRGKGLRKGLVGGAAMRGLYVLAAVLHCRSSLQEPNRADEEVQSPLQEC